MKRILIIAVLCLSALTAKAQTIEVVIGQQPRIFLEKTKVSENATSFAYIEGSYKGGAMVKLFHEQKWWEAPAYIHAEYQSSFNGTHTMIAGGSYSFGLPNGFISLSPLYNTIERTCPTHSSSANFCIDHSCVFSKSNKVMRPK